MILPTESYFAAAVAADLHLGLRHEHRDLLQTVDQRRRVGDLELVPVDAAILVDRDDDVLRLAFANLVDFLRQLDRNRRRDDGIVIRKMISSTSITSTRGVVLMVETTSSSPSGEPTFIATAYPLTTVAFGAVLSKTACRSAPKLRTRSIADLLRRTSQL
jgi:hypothetical protein